MKIRLIIASLAGGGSERVAVRLANYWVKAGRNVEILLVRKSGPYLDALDKRVVLKSSGRERTRHALFAIAREINLEPEIPVLVFGFDLGAGLGILRRCRAVRAPVIYREGSMPSANVHGWHRALYRLFVSGVDGVIAQSNRAASELAGLGLAQNTVVVSNPVDEVLRSPPRPCKGREDNLEVLSVGRLSSEKGFERLIAAWPKILKEWPRARLTIYGEGPERDRLDTAIRRLELASCIRLAGFKRNVTELYRGYDLFILPSYYEGAPNALLEALHAGCRVLSAGGNGVQELLAGLGLQECWLANSQFDVELSARLSFALSLPAGSLERASTLSIQRTNIANIADEYWRFCASV